MNDKIGTMGSVIHFCSLAGFVFCLLIGFPLGNYVFGILIALSFVLVISAFASFSKSENKSAVYAAMIFAAVYAILILVVYFAQVTTVRQSSLSEQAALIISSQKFGLFFNYDLLGYGIMSLAVFFIGLTIQVKTKSDKILKRLMLIHGIFFTSSFIPVTGAFSNMAAEQSNQIGPMIQSFWCCYYAVIDVFSFSYFKKQVN
jgi:general stress protein CsbA